MSSSAVVGGRDIAGGRALVKETKRIARTAIAQRTAARFKKILLTPTNTVVDLYPGSGSWELHSRSGALTFVRGATELLTATETPPWSNQWVLENVATVTEVTEVIYVDLESPRDDRVIPEPIDDQGPD